MKKIEYFEGKTEFLKEIKPLWEKQRDYHAQISKHFFSLFDNIIIEERINSILSGVADDLFMIFLAKDIKLSTTIGYSVVTINKNNIGTIESLFVEEEYRSQKIGKNLMQKSLAWLDSNNIEKKELIVATGNEGVYEFYKQFDFYPHSTKFLQKV